MLRLHVKCIHSFVVAQADLVKIQENTRKNLEVEIQGYKAEAQKQRQVCARAAAVAVARAQGMRDARAAAGDIRPRKRAGKIRTASERCDCQVRAPTPNITTDCVL